MELNATALALSESNMAASQFRNGSYKIKYLIPKQTGKRAAIPARLESLVNSVTYGAGRRHFFNSLKVGGESFGLECHLVCSCTQ